MALYLFTPRVFVNIFFCVINGVVLVCDWNENIERLSLWDGENCLSTLKIRLLGILGVNDRHLLVSIRRTSLYRDRLCLLLHWKGQPLLWSFAGNDSSRDIGTFVCKKPLFAFVYLTYLALPYAGWCSSSKASRVYFSWDPSSTILTLALLGSIGLFSWVPWQLTIPVSFEFLWDVFLSLVCSRPRPLANADAVSTDAVPRYSFC